MGVGVSVGGGECGCITLVLLIQCQIFKRKLIRNLSNDAFKSKFYSGV